MHLKSEDDARRAIDDWRNFSTAAQAINLRKAIESMEMDQMYYDQKDNDRGIERCDACLKILWTRLAEISKK